MATKTKKKPLSPAIEDIEHEHVVTERAPAVTQPQEAVVLDAEEDPAKTLELTIQREIKKFGLADAGIEELKKKYGELTIADVEDRAGYEAVKKAWNEVRTTRTALEKKGLDIRGTYTKINKAVSVEEDRLITLLKPLENDLQVKWKKIDDDKEAEKQRKIKEEQERLQARVDDLVGAGCALTDGYYGIGGTIAIDVATLRAMPDDKYAGLLTAVQAKAVEVKAEADRLAEKQRQDLADQEAERKRLKDEGALLEQLKAQLDKDMQELADLKKAALKTKLEGRLDRLHVLGMTLKDETMIFDNGWGQHWLEVVNIMAADEEGFQEMVATAKEQIGGLTVGKQRNDFEKAEEKKVLETKKLYINDLLIAAGLTYQYGTECFTFKNDFFEYTKHMQELVPVEEEELGALAERLTTQVEEAKAKQVDADLREKNRLQDEKYAKLGDVENLRLYFAKYWAVMNKPPTMKSDTFKLHINEFHDQLDKLLKEYHPAQETVPA